MKLLNITEGLKHPRKLDLSLANLIDGDSVKLPQFVESLKGCPRIMKSIRGDNVNYLKTLYGGPEIVDIFKISRSSSLKSLEHSPRQVNKEFYIEKCNNLENLVGSPEIAKLYMIQGCDKIKNLNGISANAKTISLMTLYGLESIDGLPRNFNGSLKIVQCNKLTELVGLPKTLKYLYIWNCPIMKLNGAIKVNQFSIGYINIDSFVGFPKEIKTLHLRSGLENLKSLKDIHKHIIKLEEIEMIGVNIESHILGLLMIRGLKKISYFPSHSQSDKSEKAMNIVKSFLESKNVLACHSALVEAGLEEFALT